MLTFPINFFSSAAPSGGVFTPTDASGLTLWLDASDGATITKDASNRVSLWADKSMNGFDLAQSGSVSLCPLHGTAMMNGLDIVDFDGNMHYLLSSASLANMITASDFNLFAVFAVDSFVAGSEYNFYQNAGLMSDTLGYWGVHLADISGAGEIQAYAYDGTLDAVRTPLPASTHYLVTIRHTGGNMYQGVNAGSESSVANGDTGNLTGQVNLGANLNRSKHFDGKIAEILVYNANLSAADRAGAQNYLKNKWGIV